MLNLFKLIIVILCLVFTSSVDAQVIFWEHKGLIGTYIGHYAEDKNGRLYASEWQALGDSIFFSDDGGENWQSYGEVNDSFFINISGMVILETNEIVISSWGQYGGIYKSTDGSRTWELKSAGLMTNTFSKIIKSSDTLYVGTKDGVYLSIDDGECWVKQNVQPDSIEFVEDIVLSEDGKLFAIDFDDAFISTDQGVSWDTINSGIKHTNFCCLAVSNESFVFLGLYGNGIYRLSNSGNIWEHKRPAAVVRSMSATSSGYIIAGTEFSGILLSTDNGESWQQNNSGLPPLPNFTNSVYFDGEGYAYCSIYHFGVYKSNSPVVTVNDDHSSPIKSYVLYQNYPNPFNPSTTIKYQLPERSSVTLKVYDLLGSKIATLVDQEQDAGIYEVDFTNPIGSSPGSNDTRLTSGIYFYSFTAGSFYSTKKLILLK